MEINTEINKVFGEEMAKLFASKISEEELLNMANKVWNNMINEGTNTWGDRKKPEIEKLVREKILDKLYEKIEGVLKEPINEELLENKAREMVSKARQVAEETIVREIAKNMVDTTLSIYGRDESIFNEVMSAVNIEIDQKINGRYR